MQPTCVLGEAVEQAAGGLAVEEAHGEAHHARQQALLQSWFLGFLGHCCTAAGGISYSTPAEAERPVVGGCQGRPRKSGDKPETWNEILFRHRIDLLIRKACIWL